MKTKLLLIFLLSALFTIKSVNSQNQIITTNLEKTQFPTGIKYIGEIKSAVRWADKSGDNIVITTESGETKSKTSTSDDSRDAALYAFHYIVGSDSTYLTWKVYDFVKDCPLDIEVNFIKNIFQVTDLNNDGVAEVWLMYKIACLGDISPRDMKIIMYQGQQKYAMRGQNKVQITDNEFCGGDYQFDKAFSEGPAIFKDFAKKLWDKNIMQTWGE